MADAVSSDYLPLGTTCSLSRAVNHRARSQSLAWISVLESGDQAIFLALQPDPLVDAAGAVAFAKQAGGYIIVWEVSVEMQPGARQISAANVHQRCEQQCHSKASRSLATKLPGDWVGIVAKTGAGADKSGIQPQATSTVQRAVASLSCAATFASIHA